MADGSMETVVAVLSNQLETMGGRLERVEARMSALEQQLTDADLARMEHARSTERLLHEIRADQKLEFAKRDEFTRGAKWSIYIAWVVLTSGFLLGAVKLIQIIPKGN